MGGGEDRPGIAQGPRAELCNWGGGAEDQRLRRDRRELFLDQGGAAMQMRCIEPPVALDRTQLACRVGDRSDCDFLRIEPDIGRPGGWPRWPRRDQQPAMAEIDSAELPREFLLEPLGG